MTRPARRPRVRTERLLVQDVLDEIVVYDLDRNVAHSFNPTVASVWTECVR